MGFFRFDTDPEKKQAKLNVSLTVSPTLSISDPNAALRLTVTVSIASTKHEGWRPRASESGRWIYGHLRAGGFTSLRSTGDDSKDVALGRGYRMQFHSDSDAEDQLERGSRFLTVPPSERENLEAQQDAAVTKATTTITHELDWKRIFRFEETRTRDDLVPGEKFEISMNEGSIGTNWWCWGDLDGDLKGKKLHIWHEHEGYYGEEKPQKDNSWVLGEDPMHLDWEDITPEGKAIFTIVE
ncbi:uncharacterized protein PG998_006440 [Apiospora kogelbergensis]|uniref:uncharacterized protein n=1 Tax=Apiospora kogelbergensis TaxID=1337665 RepID=UPI0031324EE7